MTHAARVELTNEVRKRYCAAVGAEKSKILDEFIAVTGYHHKSAIRALNAEPIFKKRRTRARPALYDEAVQAALIVLWEASDRAATELAAPPSGAEEVTWCSMAGDIP